jgi:hypothetical protein
MFVAQFQVLSRQLSGETVENHENAQLRSRSMGRHLNSELHQHASGVIPNQLPCLVWNNDEFWAVLLSLHLKSGRPCGLGSCNFGWRTPGSGSQNRAGQCSGKAVSLYSNAARFKSRLEHRISWFRYSMAFFSPFKLENLRIVSVPTKNRKENF